MFYTHQTPAKCVLTYSKTSNDTLLQDWIERYRNIKNEPKIGVFEEYDRVDRKGLWKVLHMYGVGGSFYANRKVCMKIKEKE